MRRGLPVFAGPGIEFVEHPGSLTEKHVLKCSQDKKLDCQGIPTQILRKRANALTLS